jgi:DNA-directed RNA polymerase specialized sigma24 family protein
MDITDVSFNRFLAWLNPDRELAAEEYEHIRKRLIVFFSSRGCAIPEDLADKAINQVIHRIGKIDDPGIIELKPYFRKVAQNLLFEYVRDYVKKTGEPWPENPPGIWPAQQGSDDENAYVCLEKCLQGLTLQDRDMIVEYYQENKQAKIDLRKMLADKMNMTIVSLRVRIHRITEKLRICVRECLGEV